MHESRYAPASITSFVSAISFVHKLLGVEDTCEMFCIKKLLQASRRLAGSQDGRLPITKTILSSILQATESVFSCLFTRCRFIAMCTLAFHALLRPGEMTDSHNNLLLSDIQLNSQQIIVQFRCYKHSQGLPPTHTISAKSEPTTCPVKYMAKFLAITQKGFPARPSLHNNTRGSRE